MTRHFIPTLSVFLLVAFAGLTALPPPAAARASTNEEGAAKFIKSLSDQAIKSLTTKNITRDERIVRFRKLFKERFAVRGIGKWILGRYWRKASKDERAEYLRLFEDLMVVSYVNRFSSYAGESLKFIKTVPDNATTTTVYTEITQPVGGPPVHIDWRVGSRNDLYKIVDVIVEGTSMSNTLRSDFGSIIRQKGGSIEGLISALRKKTASLE
jgi:phospholipid transport system substrate-binding protein